MNLLTNLIRACYLILALIAGIFIVDYTGFDREFGGAYHKHIKAPLIKWEILRQRDGWAEAKYQELKQASKWAKAKYQELKQASEPQQASKPQKASKPQEDKPQPSTGSSVGTNSPSGLNRFISSLLDKLGNLIFSPFGVIVIFIVYIIIINRSNRSLAAFRFFPAPRH